MKFLVLLTFTVVFLSVFTRADDDEEEYEDEEYDDEYTDPKVFASAMQLNNNNVGDIHNVKGLFGTVWMLLRTFFNWILTSSELWRRATQ